MLGNRGTLMLMNIKLRIVVLAVLGCGLAIHYSSPKAHAHVIISDQTKKVGAVLHITPNDDPVAGQFAGLSFDIKSDEDISNWAVQLKVLRPDDKQDVVDTYTTVNNVYGEYTFRGRGVYGLQLEIKPKFSINPPTRFVYYFKINRAVTGKGLAVKPPFWAQAGILVSLWVIAVLTTLVYKYRRQIINLSHY